MDMRVRVRSAADLVRSVAGELRSGGGGGLRQAGELIDFLRERGFGSELEWVELELRWSNERHTNESFVLAARRVHGDRYDYGEVEYGVSNKVNVKIRCKVHGVFEQRPHNHLCGSGCPVCGVEDTRHTSKMFISKSRKVHGDRYDYDLVEYVNNATKVRISCRVHGIFEQTPNNHLSGQKCPTCVGNVRHTTESFIAKAREVHGNRYSYDGVVYGANNQVKIEIVCLDHGMFRQTPQDHLKSKGCHTCWGQGGTSISDLLNRKTATA